MSGRMGLQLYSVRRELAADFKGTLEKISDMGYAGVELAGLPQGVMPASAVDLFNSLKLEVVAGHMNLPVGENEKKVLEEARELGLRRIVHQIQPDAFSTCESIRQACAVVNEAAANAKSAGIQIALHNHWWEFQNVEGRLAHETMLETLSADVVFEIDAYWVEVGGTVAPVSVLEKLGARVPLVHIKDGPAVQGQPHTAVGKGCMDNSAVIAAATHAEWLIVELDECASDMLEAVRESAVYLNHLLPRLDGRRSG